MEYLAKFNHWRYLKIKQNYLLIIFIIGIVLVMLFGCGLSAEEKAVIAKAKLDSITDYQGPPAADLIVAPTASYIRLLSTTKANLSWTSGVEVFLVGSDTIIVVTSPGCDNVTVIKK